MNGANIFSVEKYHIADLDVDVLYCITMVFLTKG